MVLRKKSSGVVEALFLDEGPIFTNGTKLIGDTFIDNLCIVEIRSRVLTGPTPFSGQLLPLIQHRGKGVGLDFQSSKGHTRAKWPKGGHSQVT